MPLIYKCESCNEETVLERVVPGEPLKCGHCGRERPSGSNGTSLWWMDQPQEEGVSTGPRERFPSDAERDP